MELLSKKLPSNFLDIIVGGEDVKEPKPSPEGVLLTIKELGCNKEEVLYIGDSICRMLKQLNRHKLTLPECYMGLQPEKNFRLIRT